MVAKPQRLWLYAFDLLMFRGKDIRLWPFEARRSGLFERGQMGKSMASLIYSNLTGK